MYRDIVLNPLSRVNVAAEGRDEGHHGGAGAKRRAEIPADYDFFEYRQRSYRPSPFGDL